MTDRVQVARRHIDKAQDLLQHIKDEPTREVLRKTLQALALIGDIISMTQSNRPFAIPATDEFYDFELDVTKSRLHLNPPRES
jgi:hypothetical protein